MRREYKCRAVCVQTILLGHGSIFEGGALFSGVPANFALAQQRRNLD